MVLFHVNKESVISYASSFEEEETKIVAFCLKFRTIDLI